MLLQRRDNFSDLGLPLSNCNIDTNHVLPLLIENGVQRNCRFPCLTIPDDQLPLTATDRNHRVDRLDAGLQRNGHRFARDHTGSDLLYGILFVRRDRSFAVHWRKKTVKNTADHLFSHGH